MKTPPLPDPAAVAFPAVGQFLAQGGVDANSTDARLLAGMTDGLDALEILYDRYRVIAYSIARRITNDSALAEDVVQEAFLGVWRNAGRYQATRGSVKSWLLAIVHHRAIDAVRQRKPTTELPGSELAVPARLQEPDVWGAVSSHLDAGDVRRVMDALTVVQRQAIELAYFGGLSQREIAQRIGAPLGTVKSRVRLGLLAMRAALVAEESADPGSSTLAPARSRGCGAS